MGFMEKLSWRNSGDGSGSSEGRGQKASIVERLSRADRKEVERLRRENNFLRMPLGVDGTGELDPEDGAVRKYEGIPVGYWAVVPEGRQGGRNLEAVAIRISDEEIWIRPLDLDDPPDVRISIGDLKALLGLTEDRKMYVEGVDRDTSGAIRKIRYISPERRRMEAEADARARERRLGPNAEAARKRLEILKAAEEAKRAAEHREQLEAQSSREKPSPRGFYPGHGRDR